MSSQSIVQWNYTIYFQYFHIRGSFFNNFLHQLLENSAFLSKEIINIQGLFVLTVGYLDMTTYLPIKYYYIIESVYFIYRLFVLFISRCIYHIHIHYIHIYIYTYKYNIHIYIHITYIHTYNIYIHIYIYIYIHLHTLYIHILLYTVSWRYKRDYLQASIYILFYTMLYFIYTMKKHKTLLYHVRSYNTKKVPI